MRDLEDLLSKLNPMAEEFVPPSLAAASPTAYAYYPTPTPSHVFPAVDGLAGPRPRVTPTNHLRSLFHLFPRLLLFLLILTLFVSSLLFSAEEGRRRRWRRRVRWPGPRREAPDEQPHQHGAARRGHPPHRLRLRHRSPGHPPPPPHMDPVHFSPFPPRYQSHNSISPVDLIRHADFLYFS